jgi:hypothetical protein
MNQRSHGRRRPRWCGYPPDGFHDQLSPPDDGPSAIACPREVLQCRLQPDFALAVPAFHREGCRFRFRVQSAHGQPESNLAAAQSCEKPAGLPWFAVAARVDRDTVRANARHNAVVRITGVGVLTVNVDRRYFANATLRNMSARSGRMNEKR